MRTMFVALVALLGFGACRPEVGFGTYLCGHEQDCPEGQSCNGPDNVCVRKADALPFACKAFDEHEPDNDVTLAMPLGAMDCVSLPTSLDGCLADGDPDDWYTFDVPIVCEAVVARIRITYPVAFEQVPFELTNDAGLPLEQSGDCGATETTLDDLGLESQCLRRTVTRGKSFAIHVKSDSLFNCDGACAFNRYSLTAQLETP